MARVKVDQKDGEIRIAAGGEAPKVYTVKDGTVNVDDADLDQFLLHVEGSSVEGAKPASSGEEK